MADLPEISGGGRTREEVAASLLADVAYRELLERMSSYEPPPNLRLHHAGFIETVDMLRLANRALISNPPKEAEWQRLTQDALTYFDSVIADYADYGTSLGLVIWPGVCAGIPDHARC